MGKWVIKHNIKKDTEEKERQRYERKNIYCKGRQTWIKINERRKTKHKTQTQTPLTHTDTATKAREKDRGGQQNNEVLASGIRVVERMREQSLHEDVRFSLITTPPHASSGLTPRRPLPPSCLNPSLPPFLPPSPDGRGSIGSYVTTPRRRWLFHDTSRFRGLL